MVKDSSQGGARKGLKGPNERHYGFVSFVSEDNKRVRVRVKDQESPHNGKVLTVTSVHDNIVLAQGLNVSFLIGNFDNESKQPLIHRAVDVQLA